ncbi:NVEALA domain-containing protein [Parabacteroides sp.]|uniref:NVEALA domain-containing protein n=1 Tax=Parabacteroides sp. TaxID=1869337 RepID=UPI00259BC2DA|nr:NVEALA domain-containing protein [uncultured Parabacteroides sp.]
MKKKILGVAIIATLAITAGWNYQQNKQNTDFLDLTLANVEALARGEGSSACETLCPKSGYMCILRYSDGTLESCPDRWS